MIGGHVDWLFGEPLPVYQRIPVQHGKCRRIEDDPAILVQQVA